MSKKEATLINRKEGPTGLCRTCNQRVALDDQRMIDAHREIGPRKEYCSGSGESPKAGSVSQ